MCGRPSGAEAIAHAGEDLRRPDRRIGLEANGGDELLAQRRVRNAEGPGLPHAGQRLDRAIDRDRPEPLAAATDPFRPAPPPEHTAALVGAAERVVIVVFGSVVMPGYFTYKLHTVMPGVLKVGSQQSYIPGEFFEEGKDKVQGFSVDFIDEIGKRLNLTVEWQQVDY